MDQHSPPQATGVQRYLGLKCEFVALVSEYMSPKSVHLQFHRGLYYPKKFCAVIQLLSGSLGC